MGNGQCSTAIEQVSDLHCPVRCECKGDGTCLLTVIKWQAGADVEPQNFGD